MSMPHPTPIFRLIHVDNFDIILQRSGIPAPNNTLDDGLVYKTIHDVDIQSERSMRNMQCGPCGVIHD